MRQQRRQYRPALQGSDNSALYGAAALATLAAGGYLGYRHLTKDKRKPTAPVPATPPKEHTPSAREEYAGSKGWGFNLPSAKKDIKDHGYGLADGKGSSLGIGLGIGASSLGLQTASEGGKFGPQLLKQLKNPKALLAAALLAGGVTAYDNSITGLRRLTLPNATLNRDNYAAGIGETLGAGAIGAGGALYASNLYKDMVPRNPASRLQRAMVAIGKRPGRAALTGAILGLTGGYLGDSFNERK